MSGAPTPKQASAAPAAPGAGGRTKELERQLAELRDFYNKKLREAREELEKADKVRRRAGPRYSTAACSWGVLSRSFQCLFLHPALLAACLRPPHFSFILSVHANPLGAGEGEGGGRGGADQGEARRTKPRRGASEA